MTPLAIEEAIQLGIVLAPKLIDFFSTWLALKKEYPAITPEMLVGLLNSVTPQANTAFDSMQAQIDAHRKAFLASQTVVPPVVK